MPKPKSPLLSIRVWVVFGLCAFYADVALTAVFSMYNALIRIVFIFMTMFILPLAHIGLVELMKVNRRSKRP